MAESVSINLAGFSGAGYISDAVSKLPEVSGVVYDPENSEECILSDDCSHLYHGDDYSESYSGDYFNADEIDLTNERNQAIIASLADDSQIHGIVNVVTGEDVPFGLGEGGLAGVSEGKGKAPAGEGISSLLRGLTGLETLTGIVGAVEGKGKAPAGEDPTVIGTSGVTFPEEVTQSLQTVTQQYTAPADVSQPLENYLVRTNETDEMFDFRSNYAKLAIEKGFRPDIAVMLGQAQLNVSSLGLKYPEAIQAALTKLNTFITTPSI